MASASSAVPSVQADSLATIVATDFHIMLSSKHPTVHGYPRNSFCVMFDAIRGSAVFENWVIVFHVCKWCWCHLRIGWSCKAAIFRLEQKPFRGYLHSHQSLHCLQWRRFLGWTGKHGRHIHGAVMQKFVMNCEGDGDVSKKRTSDKHTEIVPPPRI